MDKSCIVTPSSSPRRSDVTSLCTSCHGQAKEAGYELWITTYVCIHILKRLRRTLLLWKEALPITASSSVRDTPFCSLQKPQHVCCSQRFTSSFAQTETRSASAESSLHIKATWFLTLITCKSPKPVTSSQTRSESGRERRERKKTATLGVKSEEQD